MELTACDDNKVVTVSSMQKENKLTSADWNVICFSLASAIKYMHLKNLLHNDLKSDNVLLKLKNNVWIPKTKTLDFIISLGLHLVYQAACIILVFYHLHTHVFMRNRFKTTAVALGKLNKHLSGHSFSYIALVRTLFHKFSICCFVLFSFKFS